MELQENKQQEGPLVSGGGQDLVNVLLSKLDSISLDVNSIKTDMASMKVEHTNLIATVNSIKVDLTNKFEIVNKKLKENSTQILLLKKEKNAMKKELENTYSLINENLQSTQYNFIRILNVPVSENDNPMLAVKKISETINFVFNADKIDFCYRRKSRNNYSAPIFLKFLSDKDKNSFLKQKQLNKPKLTTNLFNDGNSRPIYISEYMSPFNNALFKKGKELKDAGHIHSVWFSRKRVWYQRTVQSTPTMVKKMDDYPSNYSDTMTDIDGELDTDFSEQSFKMGNKRTKKRKSTSNLQETLRPFLVSTKRGENK